MSRTGPVAWRLRWLLPLLLLGNQPDCDTREPTIDCSDFSLTLDPGSCVDIDNPCRDGGEWRTIDSFRLCDLPNQLLVRTQGNQSNVNVQICASSEGGPLVNKPVSFLYEKGDDFGQGAVTITTAVFQVDCSNQENGDGAGARPFPTIAEALEEAASQGLAKVAVFVAPGICQEGRLEITRDTEIRGLGQSAFDLAIIGSIVNEGPHELILEKASVVGNTGPAGVFVDNPCASTVLRNVSIREQQPYGIFQRSGELMGDGIDVFRTLDTSAFDYSLVFPDPAGFPALLSGTGILLAGGVRARLESVNLEANQGGALSVQGPETQVCVTDLTVRDTEVNRFFEDEVSFACPPVIGFAAVEAANGARLRVTGFKIERSQYAGIFVHGDEAHAQFEQQGIVPGIVSETAGGPGDFEILGINAVAADTGRLSMRNFLLEKARAAAIQILDDNEACSTSDAFACLINGEISNNPIGANVQAPLDLNCLQNNVSYRDNDLDLDAPELPIPEPIPPPFPDGEGTPPPDPPTPVCGGACASLSCDFPLGLPECAAERPPLSVEAAADPDNIPAGGSSQLSTSVRGAPPFSYSWEPADGLSATDVADPVASPTLTTEYTVTVMDANGSEASASVRVEVGVSLVATATPAVISPGESSQLQATVEGGTPPLTFSWEPTASLDNASVASPVATPDETTIYRVTAVDSLGTELMAEVTVTVGLVVSVSATPSEIPAGEASQLLASAQGGQSPYSYQWTPADSLDASNVENPSATPSITTTYTVDVTDSAMPPASVTGDVTVTVTEPEPGELTVCFTPAGGDPPQPFPNPVDASCSDAGPDGPIVEYCWWWQWNEAFRNVLDGLPDFCTADTVAFVPPSEIGTSRIVRLRVEDSVGARAEVINTFGY